MDKSLFTVSIPLTGYVTVEVYARDRQEARELAMEKATIKDLNEWELHEKIVQGNVDYAMLNEIDVM